MSSSTCVEWQVLLNAGARHAGRAGLQGAMALNVSSPSSDVGVMARYFAAANFSPNGFNFEQWKDDAVRRRAEDAGGVHRPEGDRRRRRARRMSGWWTIRPGCSSSTTSIRAR